MTHSPPPAQVHPLPSPPSSANLSLLKACRVPLASLGPSADCDSCDHRDDREPACLEDWGFPKGFNVEHDVDTLGAFRVCQWGRMVLVGTGKTDWAHEVIEDQGSMTAHLHQAYLDLASRPSPYTSSPTTAIDPSSDQTTPSLPEGLYSIPSHPLNLSISSSSSHSTKLGIWACSAIPANEDDDASPLYVFPDYKVVLGARKSSAEEDARRAVERYLHPDVGNVGVESSTLDGLGQAGLKSWVLPYRAVILICSHKTRDKRCHIAAPLLIESISIACEAEGWEVHTRGDEFDPQPTDAVGPIEDLDSHTAKQVVKDRLKAASNEDKVLLLRVSHLSGHKHAGNMAIWFPNGATVWYMKVTPRDAPALVSRTLKRGQVVQEWLRGGFGLHGKEGKEGGILSFE